MSGIRYTLAEDEIIYAMRADGKSDGEIARTLSRPYWSVKKRCQRLRLKRNGTSNPPAKAIAPRGWSKDEIADLHQMYGQGKTDAEIAQHLRRGLSSVASKRYAERLVTSHGGPRNDAVPSPAVSEWCELPDGHGTMMRTVGAS